MDYSRGDMHDVNVEYLSSDENIVVKRGRV